MAKEEVAFLEEVEALTKGASLIEGVLRAGQRFGAHNAGRLLPKLKGLGGRATTIGSAAATHPLAQSEGPNPVQPSQPVQFKQAAPNLQSLKNFATRAKGTVDDLVKVPLGRNVDEAVEKAHTHAMRNKYMQTQAKYNPGDMGTTEEFIRDTLRGTTEIPWVSELPSASKGRLNLLNRMKSGRRQVAAEQARTRASRVGIGSGVALPLLAVGGFELGKEGAATVPKKSDLKAKVKEVAPAAIGAAAAAAPIIQGIGSGALRVRPDIGRQFQSVAKLRKSLKPGDIILTSHPGKGGKWKSPIALLGGDPYGYHIETATKIPKRGKAVEFVHSSPGVGGAAGYVGDLDELEDVVVRRFKTPAQRKEYLKNLASREHAEDVLEEVFGEEARATRYDKTQAGKAGAKSFLPKRLQKLFQGGAPGAGKAICSSLPGMASPVCMVPGVHGKDVLPHHIRSTKALKTVGSYRAPRTMGQKAFERLLQAGPWALRGALGAGLGYGAYRGAKALMASDD